MERRALLKMAVVASAGIGIALTGGTALAAHGRLFTPIMPVVGTWDCTTTFLSGPNTGQTGSITFTFLATGVLKVQAPFILTDGVAWGRWWYSGFNQITYEFSEKVSTEPPSQVHVQHVTSSIARDKFVSTGQGDVYDLEGHYLFSAKTSTVGIRTQPSNTSPFGSK